MTGKSLIAERLRMLINEHGVTQRWVAEQAGVTEATIGRYIHGERNPSGRTATKIAAALHVSTDYLLGIDAVEDQIAGYYRALGAVKCHAGAWTAEQKTALVTALFQCEEHGGGERNDIP